MAADSISLHAIRHPPSEQRQRSVAEREKSVVIPHGQMRKTQSQDGHHARRHHKSNACSRNVEPTQCEPGEEG